MTKAEETQDENAKRKHIQYVMQILSNKILDDVRAHQERHKTTAKELESLRSQVNKMSEEKDNLERDLIAKADEAQRQHATELQ